MIAANHQFQQRSLNALDENGNEGCAFCGRPRDVHPAPVTAATPGQAAFAARYDRMCERNGWGESVQFRWEGSTPEQQADWEAAARAGHAAIAAQDARPAPGYVTINARDIAIALNGYAGFTGDPVSFASELHERLRRTVFADQPKPAPEQVPAEALDIAWNALQHIALHAGDGKTAAKARETLRAVNEYLEDGTTTDGIDRTPRVAEPQPAPELAALRARIADVARGLDSMAKRAPRSRTSAIRAGTAAILRDILEDEAAS